MAGTPDRLAAFRVTDTTGTDVDTALALSLQTYVDEQAERVEREQEEDDRKLALNLLEEDRKSMSPAKKRERSTSPEADGGASQ
eukprot:gene31264-13400_t